MNELVDISLALIAGGAVTAFVTGLLTKKKTDAEAQKSKAEGDVSLIGMALQMTDRFQQSIISLEAKTDGLAKNNIRLEQELTEIRIKNLTLSQEIELVKTKNADLDRTCSLLMKENTELKLELENCIKKG